MITSAIYTKEFRTKLIKILKVKKVINYCKSICTKRYGIFAEVDF